MSEREDVVIKRKNCQTALRALRDAVLTLDTLPQYLCDKAGPSSRVALSDANGEQRKVSSSKNCMLLAVVAKPISQQIFIVKNEF